MSCLRVSQCFLKNLKEKPSGPGALQLPQSQTVALISSMVKEQSRECESSKDSCLKRLLEKSGLDRFSSLKEL
ncbi:hypothetical protein Tco_0301810, partial [Tanacetum coccineum]